MKKVLRRFSRKRRDDRAEGLVSPEDTATADDDDESLDSSSSSSSSSSSFSDYEVPDELVTTG